MALPPSRSSGPFRPTRLGQWEVIAKIAGGGMSAVYLGRRAEPAPDIPNVVALKIARHELRMDERMLNMFLEEGKLIARLVHPNIVRTLEVGGDAELDFIAMELMLGRTFASIYDAITLREVRLNPEIVAWTAARVADALHYAHELADESGQPLGLVHRDVNPANVFATFSGEVKLFDFGLAKVTAQDASGSHMLAGKLSYLSPEQIMQMPLDRRSDIFSLGTTLWELLTGRRLFRRDNDLDTVRAVQLGPIPDPRAVAPEVPEELARIAKTALERNREHRYPNASQLARELDAFVFQRSSATEVTARLAQLVDTLFPGEQKRQSGWLKPAVSSSPSRQMGAVTPGTVMTPSSSPLSRPVARTPAPLGPRETTEVMATAPLRVPPPLPAFVDTSHDLPTATGYDATTATGYDTGLRDSIPGPVTPRDGVGSLADMNADESTLLPPTTEREAMPSFSPSPRTPRSPELPPSSTMTAVSPSALASESGPIASRPLPPGPLSNRPWSQAAPSAPPAPAPAPPRAATHGLVPPPPPLPQRQRVPIAAAAPSAPPRPPAARPSGPPPLPPMRQSDEDLSKTDIQFTPPTVASRATRGASTSASPRANEANDKSGQSVKPTFPPPRPKRPPVPLPSRTVPPKASTAPKKPVTDPPSSDTQVDRQGPRKP